LFHPLNDLHTIFLNDENVLKKTRPAVPFFETGLVVMASLSGR
jgi:hypothetical protein